MEIMLRDMLEPRGYVVKQHVTGAGHAAIFCVTDQSGDDVYVAKVVSLSGLDAKGRAAAMQEVSMLRGLAKHPNLIGYRDSFMSEGLKELLIVMSFAEDGDLLSVVSRAKGRARCIPEPVTTWWTRQVLEGLQHIHAQGVIHRDLKSSNVFLCDNMSRILIGDFGISIVLESTSWAMSTVGTPAYMSPELMRNEKYDYHVDMWALGCIVYELTSLRLAFEATSLLDLAVKVINTEPDWSLCREASPELLSVTQRLLRKEALQRPTSSALLGEPFFAGGPGAQMPAPALWEVVREKGGSVGKVPALELTKATSAGRSAAKSSSEGSWISTPPLPWSSSSQATTSAALSDSLTGATTASSSEAASPVRGVARDAQFAQAIQAAHGANYQYSREDFQNLLSTYNKDVLSTYQKDIAADIASARRFAAEDAADRPPEQAERSNILETLQ